MSADLRCAQELSQRQVSRMITAIERGGPRAAEIMSSIGKETGHAFTVGITGPPGAGKSTLVSQLTNLLRNNGLTVGIIAVDPSSPFTGGALLGDRVRMQKHYLDEGVFIRSIATRGQSGGIPRIVKSVVRLLEAVGKDVVIVETVGVGQTELGIMNAVDSVVVTLMPESGDTVQTLKAGIMEIADVYVVNKSDLKGAHKMSADITAMLNLSSTMHYNTPPVVLTQADAGMGIEDLWQTLKAHHSELSDRGLLKTRRAQRRRSEFLDILIEELKTRLDEHILHSPDLNIIIDSVSNGESEPYSEAMAVLEGIVFSLDIQDVRNNS